MKTRTHEEGGRVVEERFWTVGEVAALARVSVRTLHHYDEIGLLNPSGRSAAGYRLYARADLDRLHQILLYRELGFPLSAIGRVLDAPTADRRSELEAQRALLVERLERTAGIVRAVDRTLEAMERGTTMSTEEMFEGFEDLDQAPDDVARHHRRHAREAHERWGTTDAYAESMRRAKRYAKDEWEKLRSESEAQEEHVAWLMEAGVEPDDARAREAAEAMREHISRWFYECSPEMHAGLADLYEADPRFEAHYEKRAPGLARFTAAAIRANARARGAEV